MNLFVYFFEMITTGCPKDSYWFVCLFVCLHRFAYSFLCLIYSSWRLCSFFFLPPLNLILYCFIYLKMKAKSSGWPLFFISRYFSKISCALLKKKKTKRTTWTEIQFQQLSDCSLFNKVRFILQTRLNAKHETDQVRKKNKTPPKNPAGNKRKFNLFLYKKRCKSKKKKKASIYW